MSGRAVLLSGFQFTPGTNNDILIMYYYLKFTGEIYESTENNS